MDYAIDTIEKAQLQIKGRTWNNQRTYSTIISRETKHCDV